VAEKWKLKNMNKKKKRGRIKNNSNPRNWGNEDSLSFYSEMNSLKKQLEKLRENFEKLQERTEDAEIHINLLTRLLTTLCVEKFGMRIGVLKRLLKRIEKEAIRDSQIFHLESLYNLPHQPEKKSSLSSHPPKRDPWEDIS
jgi:DNA repair exonuclease SbcCD ATPase subunit